MGLLDIFRRNQKDGDGPLVPETRASGTGYTAAIMAARASYITGGSDIAELTSAAQTCVSLWEGVLSGADVSGTDLLDRPLMGIVARSLALRGEFVGVIDDTITPASDWEVATRNGRPVAYKVSIPEAGGGRTETRLAGEVLHIRIGSDPVAPWTGTAPLRRAALSANLLHELEEALRDTFRDAPIGSQVLPLPDGSPEDMENMRSAIRGRQGQTLVIEGVAQATAAGMNPQLGQRRDDLTPDLKRADAAAILTSARGSVAECFGVPAAYFNLASTGPAFREIERHLVTYTLLPIAKTIEGEATTKLGGAVSVDVERPFQSWDNGARARSMSAIIKAMAEAKEAGIDPEAAMRLVGWE
jgi:phage portal protein BeeE